VTSLLTTKGAAVDAATPVARVQDLDHLVVTLDLSEFDVSRTRTGALAHITVDALGGREFGGHVLDVALSGNENGGVVNFPVTIALGPKSHGRLRPGMSVRARIVVMSRDRVVRIPLAAVSDRGNHPSVLVRGRSGAFTKRSVKLGLAGTEVVEVLSGLRTGERVLIPSGP
jgi:multidrug efflux pump subunit AcrA (membrane-fusion protein)